MPKYDYKCNLCGSQIEVERQFGEDREPSCCGKIMTRMWSSFGIQFKGSGFYSTDNRK